VCKKTNDFFLFGKSSTYFRDDGICIKQLRDKLSEIDQSNGIILIVIRIRIEMDFILRERWLRFFTIQVAFLLLYLIKASRGFIVSQLNKLGFYGSHF